MIAVDDGHTSPRSKWRPWPDCCSCGLLSNDIVSAIRKLQKVFRSPFFDWKRSCMTNCSGLTQRRLVTLSQMALFNTMEELSNANNMQSGLECGFGLVYPVPGCRFFERSDREPD